MGIMTGQAAASRRDAWDGSTAWLGDWFARHGLVGVPVSDIDRQTLAVSVAAEFDSWCEAHGISPRRQDRARVVARRRLPADVVMNGTVRSAALDVAARHDPRVGLLPLAS